jgi:transposase-like protein
MKETTGEQRAAGRSEYWREQIAQQEGSGLSVQRFCERRGVTEQSFYVWRKRLQKQQPVRFALVETAAAERPCGTEPSLELVLAKGERLRIGVGVDPTVLRTVLEVLRA